MPSISSILIAFLFITTILQTSVLGNDDTEGRNGSIDSANESGNNAPGRYRKCETLLERQEWRTLTDPQKAEYIKAVKCLQEHPAHKPVIKEARTRFDEFQAYHISIADRVHVAGQFLPWHRQFVKSYEIALREECGYKGAAPYAFSTLNQRWIKFLIVSTYSSYWDWTQDIESLHKAPVYDPLTGFGGDGVPGTYTLPPYGNDSRIFPEAFRGCVQDGPFANYTLNVGPGKLVTRHCFTRGIQDSFKRYLSAAEVANATKLPTFELFRIELEGEPVTPDHKIHDGGHISIGGEMSNFYSSPGDPLFYLHHANLDRIWWNWQQMVPHRLYEISGQTSPVPPSQNVTLDYVLLMDSVGVTLPIRDVMDIHSGPSCYTYV